MSLIDILINFTSNCCENIFRWPLYIKVNAYIVLDFEVAWCFNFSYTVYDWGHEGKNNIEIKHELAYRSCLIVIINHQQLSFYKSYLV